MLFRSLSLNYLRPIEVLKIDSGRYNKKIFRLIKKTEELELNYRDITTFQLTRAASPRIINDGRSGSMNKFKNVYANYIYSTAQQTDALNNGNGTYVQASVAATSGTIPVRTSSSQTVNGVTVSAGSLQATYFVGTASTALYADLAENYIADKEYEVGTVVSVGGEQEVTASKWGDRALGAVSQNPAYLMNFEQKNGTPVALKGRVPVKVIGAVTKGQRLVAANDGCAVAAVPHANDVFAISLESNSNADVKLVECVIL